MPIYEYTCKSCGHVFDVLQKMGAAPLVDCPECGKPRLQKLLSAPNFRLKGSGWYETDFKKDNRRNLAGDSPDTAKKAGQEKKSPDTGKSPAKKPGTAAKSGAPGASAD